MIEGVMVAEQMKAELRRLARSVTVISTRDQHRSYAMTATAVTELSLDPPSFLVCVNKAAAMFAPLADGANFSINVLDRQQQDISAACSGKVGSEDRFQLGNWAVSRTLEIPYLADSQVSFVCRADRNLTYGTHGLFIGEVVEIHSSGVIDPLIYVDGAYHAQALRRTA